MYVCVTDILFWYIDLCDNFVAVVDVKLMVEGILSQYQVNPYYISISKVAAMILVLRLGVSRRTNEMDDFCEACGMRILTLQRRRHLYIPRT
jgi:hypothetical protein